MAPSSTARRTPSKKQIVEPQKQLIRARKQLFQAKKQEASRGLSTITSSTCNNSTNSKNIPKIEDKEIKDGGGTEVSSNECSTPKGQRHRIPKISSCPPAPKKRRVVSHCSPRRTPISFFASPDIELFFYFALPNISV